MISNKRNAYIDILKTTAILSVIFCHLQLNIGNDNNVVWYIRCNNKIIDVMWYIFGYIFSNLSVPIFMLLTGANRFRNIDNEDINYKKIYLLVACGLMYFLTNDTYDKMNIYVAMLMLILFKKLSYKNNDFACFKASKIYDVISLSAKHALLFYLLHPYILKIIFRVTDKIYPKSIMYLDYPVSILILLINFICTYIIIKIYHNLRGIYEKTN